MKNVSRETVKTADGKQTERAEVFHVKQSGGTGKETRRTGPGNGIRLLDIFGPFSYHKIHCEEGKRLK